MRFTQARLLGGLAMVAASMGTSTDVRAQGVPWQLRLDPLTTIECGVINAENLELIVLESTGELVIVSEDGIDVEDVVVFESLVDDIGNIFLSGVQIGQVRFAEDANGTTTLWWLDLLSDRIYQYDRAADQATLGLLDPSGIVGLGCDPCTVWDIPADCGFMDVGGGGTVDVGTGGGNTNIGDVSSVTLNFCGANSAMSMSLTFAGLVGTSLVRRPRRRYPVAQNP